MLYPPHPHLPTLMCGRPQYKRSCLFYAASYSHVHIVTFLLDLRAPINDADEVRARAPRVPEPTHTMPLARRQQYRHPLPPPYTC